MNATKQLHDLGQSLWLDNITRSLVSDGTLQRYIDVLTVTGLTSNPTIFDQAIKESSSYDVDIRHLAQAGKAADAIFFDLALADLVRAADLLRPAHDASQAVDGYVSLEVSPELVDDAAGTRAEALRLHGLAQRPNLMIKIPGTAAGIVAIEDAIFAGVPINVTLLFSCEHYLAAAEAYLRGLERRLAAGLRLNVASVASLFISRWDRAVVGKTPAELQNRLGIAVGRQTYKAYRDLLASPRWQTLAAAGAQPQRLLWASTGTKDPAIRDTLYVEALAAPDTVNTIPEKTLLAFADHGAVGGVMPLNGGDAETVLAAYGQHGIDLAALAATLQDEGAAAFKQSWSELMARIKTKAAA
jgi:transaldolase